MYDSGFFTLSSAIEQMRRYGVRRLLVLSGESAWCYQHAQRISQQFAGDWLWLTARTVINRQCYPCAQFHSLLGREFLHAVFDASEGFHAEAFAGLAGTLAAGSLLIVIVPNWNRWPNCIDRDSLRWSEQAEPITTANFVHHLQTTFSHDNEVLFWHQGQELVGELLTERERDWQKPTGKPTAEQQGILTSLLAAKNGVYVLIADRGRGKSTLAGMLAKCWRGSGECWLTAPSKTAAEKVIDWAQGSIHFFAPDALLAQCRSGRQSVVDWLIIDEAAAIPTPLLYALLAYFPRILLTTTVQGYEGTGRGFILKFCAVLSQWQQLTLSQPIRWAIQDPLERLIKAALLLDAENDCRFEAPAWTEFTEITQADFAGDLSLLRQFYGLLTSAHYRTSPLDLRRLLDAPTLHFSVAHTAKKTVNGALWAVEEGGLSPRLTHEIWAGRRRPRGNLVAQSLAAHAGQYQAPILRSWRISRIAVHASLRRQGIARHLIDFQVHKAVQLKIDLLSVSFGYTDELWAFWQACGFQLVHIGSQKEASSGCYAAMALLPLSEAAKRLTQQAAVGFKRDWYWLRGMIDVSLSLLVEADVVLTAADWRELAGFAFAHRPIEASYAALCRLLLTTSADCNALRQYLQHACPVSVLIEVLQLAGKKALVQRWRQEAAAALLTLDRQRTLELSQWVTPGCKLEQ